MKQFIRISIAMSLAAVFMLIQGCDSVEDVFDDGPSDEPNFVAEGIGENTVTNILIEIRASRDGRDVDGEGTAVIGGEEYEINVTGASLPTDFNGQAPIPQTDDLLPIDFVCTPRFAELDVTINPGNFQTTMRLNECEDDNSDIFVEDGVVFNPCDDDAVVTDIESFNGVCLSDPAQGVDFGRDTMVIGGFDGKCGPDAPCVVPRDVLIFVPAFNGDQFDPDDIIDEF